MDCIVHRVAKSQTWLNDFLKTLKKSIFREEFIPGTSILVFLHFLCACMCAKSLQLCPTFCAPVDCSPPDSSVHRILQARILEWVALPSSRGSSWPRGSSSQGSNPCLLCLLYWQASSLPLVLLGKHIYFAHSRFLIIVHLLWLDLLH